MTISLRKLQTIFGWNLSQEFLTAKQAYGSGIKRKILRLTEEIQDVQGILFWVIREDELYDELSQRVQMKEESIDEFLNVFRHMARRLSN